MSAVTDSALARLNASIQKRSSMKWSLVGKTVDCTKKTRRPRTFWRTRTNRVPSEKRSTSPRPTSTPRSRQIATASFGLAEPANTSGSSSGAGGAWRIQRSQFQLAIAASLDGEKRGQSPHAGTVPGLDREGVEEAPA